MNCRTWCQRNEVTNDIGEDNQGIGRWKWFHLTGKGRSAAACRASDAGVRDVPDMRTRTGPAIVPQIETAVPEVYIKNARTHVGRAREIYPAISGYAGHCRGAVGRRDTAAAKLGTQYKKAHAFYHRPQPGFWQKTGMGPHQLAAESM